MQNFPKTAQYIVIASAARATNSAQVNMMRHAFAEKFLRDLKGVMAYESATGFFREAGQAEGSFEQSFIIAVRDENTLAAIRSEFCLRFEQDCILQWNRKSGSVWLTSHGDGFLAELGNDGMELRTMLDEMVDFDIDKQDAHTVTGAGYYFVVK